MNLPLNFVYVNLLGVIGCNLLHMLRQGHENYKAEKVLIFKEQTHTQYERMKTVMLKIVPSYVKQLYVPL